MAGELCGAKKTDGSGDTCKNPAGAGTNHKGVGACKFHGGATPAGETAGAREMVRRGLLYYGSHSDIEPHEALLQEVRRTAGHVTWLDAEIATRDKPETGMDHEEFTSHMQRLQTLYHAERKHLVQVCSAALAAGVEERAVQLAERMGASLAELLSGILADLDLTPKQQKGAPEIVRRHLSVIEGGRGAEAA